MLYTVKTSELVNRKANKSELAQSFTGFKKAMSITLSSLYIKCFHYLTLTKIV